MMYVMSGNKPVVAFDGNTYEYDILDKALAPLYITNRSEIDLSAMIINGIDLLSNHTGTLVTPSPTPAAKKA